MDNLVHSLESIRVEALSERNERKRTVEQVPHLEATLRKEMESKPQMNF